MSAARARTEFASARRGIKPVAADAMEGGLAPLPLKAGVIAAIIPEPERQENHRDERAVDDGGGGQSEHGGNINKNAPK